MLTTLCDVGAAGRGGASLSLSKARAAAPLGSPPLAISSKNKRCSADTALAFAKAPAASSAFAVPVGGTLQLRCAAVDAQEDAEL